MQDFSTQIAWWSSYPQECKTHGVTVGANRYVPPCLAEHIAGKMLVLIFLTVKVHVFLLVQDFQKVGQCRESAASIVGISILCSRH